VARKDTRSRRQRILIAGDKLQARNLFARKLRAEGYDIVAVGSRNAALSELRSSRYDVLVIDLDMSDLEGFGVLREIRKEIPHVRVLAVSEDMPSKVLEIATLFGATSTLEKAVAGRSLVHETRRLLGETA
jgi:CheY-like chemotaxis protein